MNEERRDCIQRNFRESDIDARHDLLDSLVQVFRPSDFRHLAKKLFPKSFVGDFVTLLPPELTDVIFSHLPPEDFYRLRHVSSLWNAYLSRPEFLHAMNGLMFGRNGRYEVDQDCHWQRERSFRERVRNRCALLNGRAFDFEVIKHHAGVRSHISYANGTLVNYLDSRICVNRLYRKENKEWVTLVGDDLESFESVQVSGEYIISITRMGTVYCWSTETLDRVARFKVPGSPFEADSCRETIILLCPGSWFFYHLPTGTLSRHPSSLNLDEDDDESLQIHMAHVESSGHIYTVSLDGAITTFELEHDPSGRTTLSRIGVQNVNNLLRQPVVQRTTTPDDFLTDADHQSSSSSSALYHHHHHHHRDHFDPHHDSGEVEPAVNNIVIVWNHGSLYASPISITGAPTRIYTLQAGVVRYAHTIATATVRPQELIFFPTLRRSFDLLCQHDRGMPLGLFQICRDAWRPVLVAPGEAGAGDQNMMMRRGGVGPAEDSSLSLDDESGEGEREGERGGRVTREVEDTAWAMRYEDSSCLWTGDANFLIGSHWHAGFTRIWRFYE